MYTENIKVQELYRNYMKDEGQYSFAEYVDLCSESDERFCSWVLGEEIDGELSLQQKKTLREFFNLVKGCDEYATIEHHISLYDGLNSSIEITKNIKLDENITLYVFDFNGDTDGTSSAIVYEDGTLLVMTDWQGWHPETLEEISDVKWTELTETPVILFNRTPRALC